MNEKLGPWLAGGYMRNRILERHADMWTLLDITYSFWRPTASIKALATILLAFRLASLRNVMVATVVPVNELPISLSTGMYSIVLQGPGQ